MFLSAVNPKHECINAKICNTVQKSVTTEPIKFEIRKRGCKYF